VTSQSDAVQRAALPNKGMKQTKPSVLELRSLSPVLDRPVAMLTERTLRPGVATDQLPLPEQVGFTSSRGGAHDRLPRSVAPSVFRAYLACGPENRLALQRGASSLHQRGCRCCGGRRVALQRRDGCRLEVVGCSRKLQRASLSSDAFVDAHEHGVAEAGSPAAALPCFLWQSGAGFG